MNRLLLLLPLIIAGCATAPAPVTSLPPVAAPAIQPPAYQPQAIIPSGPIFQHPAGRENALAFISDYARTHNVSETDLIALFNGIQPLPDVRKDPTKKSPPMTWARYQSIFMNDEVINRGRAFMADHREALARAEATYKVPAHLIAAIIGIETRYGANFGRYKVLDALAWQALTPNRRNAFFRAELQHFLTLARENRLDTASAMGSSAGAMGWPQFMPSSYRKIAIDFDGDGRSDLLNSPTDAIGSVARYFALNRWQYGAPSATPASITGAAARFVTEDSRPRHRVAQLMDAGVQPLADVPADLTAALIRMEGDAGNEYWLTHRNFRVIMLYNKSSWYALAVSQLGQALVAPEGAGWIRQAPAAAFAR